METSRGDADLWAITCYFNPCRYRRRLENYRIFRRRLALPLVAVELCYGESFDLGDGDADMLIQLRACDVMWQKERLLNVAMAAVPRRCRKIAWIDCDVFFARPDWADQTSQLLDDFMLVQPFESAVDLPRGATAVVPETEGRRSTGLVSVLASGVRLEGILREAGARERLGVAGGFAWAGRREVFGAAGLYDACVIGSGSKTIHNAALGLCDCSVEALRMNRRREEHYRAWAKPVYDAAAGRVGCAAGEVYHLWHGRLKDRSYVDRHRAFARFDFDPYEDIAVADGGPWRWNSDKPQMHRFVEEYFRSRREDG